MIDVEIMQEVELTTSELKYEKKEGGCTVWSGAMADGVSEVGVLE